MFSRIILAALFLLTIQEYCFAQWCGSGICDLGENCVNCWPDCGGCQGGCPEDWSCCGDGLCEPGEDCTNCQNDCPDDSPGCAPICGNGVCELGEDCESCASDCLLPFVGFGDDGVPITCDDGVCEAAMGENCLNCPEDCNGIQTGPPADRFCCGGNIGNPQGPVACKEDDPDLLLCSEGEFLCDDGQWTCCGDGLCRGIEDVCNCELDCGAPQATETNCDNGTDDDCDGLIDCDDPDCDCPCVPTHNNEKGPRCSDNLDNDCDGLIDCADPDCANNRACSAAAMFFKMIRSAISEIAD